jgi:hypothetical protein
MRAITDLIRDLVLATRPDGEIKKKFIPPPEIKPPRRKSPITNESSKPEYAREYMKEYREDGKDYQKIPDSVKKFRKEQKKRLKEKQGP